MNTVIGNILKDCKPKISILDEKTRRKYEAGLQVLGLSVSDNFFDIDMIGENKYEKDGYFYEIPYFHSSQLWESNNQIMLVVVYKIKDKSSCCPLRVDIKLIDEQNWGIYVYDQSGERTTKRTLIESEQGVFYTEMVNYSEVSLLELLKDGVDFEEFDK